MDDDSAVRSPGRIWRGGLCYVVLGAAVVVVFSPVTSRCYFRETYLEMRKATTPPVMLQHWNDQHGIVAWIWMSADTRDRLAARGLSNEVQNRRSSPGPPAAEAMLYYAMLLLRLSQSFRRTDEWTVCFVQTCPRCSCPKGWKAWKRTSN
jgi:hypothetical protein